MIPNWLLPSKAPLLSGNVRTHRIYTPKELEREEVNEKISESMEEARGSRIVWKKLASIGWPIKKIAEFHGVNRTTVMRAVGPSQHKPNRGALRVRYKKKVYESRTDAQRQLGIGRTRMDNLIKSGEAKILRG